MLINIVVQGLPPIKVLNLQVWEEHCHIDDTACERVERYVDFIIFKSILPNHWHGYGTQWTFDHFVAILLGRLTVLIVNREADGELDLLALDSRPRR